MFTRIKDEGVNIHNGENTFIFNAQIDNGVIFCPEESEDVQVFKVRYLTLIRILVIETMGLDDHDVYVCHDYRDPFKYRVRGYRETEIKDGHIIDPNIDDRAENLSMEPNPAAQLTEMLESKPDEDPTYLNTSKGVPDGMKQEPLPPLRGVPSVTATPTMGIISQDKGLDLTPTSPAKVLPIVEEPDPEGSEEFLNWYAHLLVCIC